MSPLSSRSKNKISKKPERKQVASFLRNVGWFPKDYTSAVRTSNHTIQICSGIILGDGTVAVKTAPTDSPVDASFPQRAPRAAAVSTAPYMQP
jgi:hypothetical protein